MPASSTLKDHRTMYTSLVERKWFFESWWAPMGPGFTNFDELGHVYCHIKDKVALLCWVWLISQPPNMSPLLLELTEVGCLEWMPVLRVYVPLGPIVLHQPSPPLLNQSKPVTGFKCTDMLMSTHQFSLYVKLYNWKFYNQVSLQFQKIKQCGLCCPISCPLFKIIKVWGINVHTLVPSFVK